MPDLARRLSSREFKLEAGRQVVGEGRTRRAVAKELGINENLLGRWVKQLRADPEQAFPGHCPSRKVRPRLKTDFMFASVPVKQP